jgi:predicted HTH transcriptional regulator
MNAFLNTSGGVLFFGIRDDGIVKGVALETSRKKKRRSNPQSANTPELAVDKLALWVDDTQHKLFVPSVRSITVQSYKLTRDRYVWSIVVPKSDRPIHYKHTVYRRLNASTVAHTTQRILTIQDANATEQKHTVVLKGIISNYEQKLSALQTDLLTCKIDGEQNET